MLFIIITIIMANKLCYLHIYFIGKKEKHGWTIIKNDQSIKIKQITKNNWTQKKKRQMPTGMVSLISKNYMSS